VCISQGSSYIRPIVERYGAIPRAFPGASQSLLALRGGSCVAAVHDAAPLLYPLLQSDPEWHDYRALQPELEPAPSVIWVRQGEHDTAAKLDTFVRYLHRNGWFIATEAKNGLNPPSPALAEWHRQLPRRTKMDTLLHGFVTATARLGLDYRFLLDDYERVPLYRAWA